MMPESSEPSANRLEEAAGILGRSVAASTYSSPMAPPTRPSDLPARRLPVAGLIGLVVVYLAILKVVGIAVEDQTDVADGRLLTTENVAWEMVVPLGAAFVFVYAVITALGWWRVVFDDPRPVQRWVGIVPVIFLLAILAGTNYGGLADRGTGFTLTLLGACLLVGFGEEGMFRAIGVTSLRQQCLTETRVALYSSLLFGAVHLSNLIGGNAGAVGQAIVVSFAGYFFYLIRRVTRSNILNSILHGGFDFMILSGTAIVPKGDDPHPGALLAILVYLACGVLLFVLRHRIEPPEPPTHGELHRPADLPHGVLPPHPRST